MIFSSFTFLFFFLPIVLIVYSLLPFIRLRNLFLLVASLIFYAWSDFHYLNWLFQTIVITYICALCIKSELFKNKKIFLFLGILCILMGLFYFKYFEFTVSILDQILHRQKSVFNIVLPVGISFYTFQAISYLVDVYRGGSVQKNFFDLALYISMFPQLVAGPIVKYSSVQDQLQKREYSLEQLYLGFRRFLMGLAKKIIIADTLGMSVDKIFETPLATLSVGIAWIGIIFYTLQIYFDFSGYSDMAIGLGKMFGFEFPENFNYPYISRSVSEFWRRWHISLSSWFKEYVYIPLGGNRQNLRKTCRNLLIVFLLTGIWHGANWTFILWGLWWAFFIVLEKCLKTYLPQHIKEKKNLFLLLFLHFYTLLVALFGWVLFRSSSLKQAFTYLKALFGRISFRQEFGASYYVRTGGWIVFGIGLLLALGAGKKMILPKSRLIRFLTDISLWVLLFCCLSFLTVTGYNPFIYFNF